MGSTQMLHLCTLLLCLPQLTHTRYTGTELQPDEATPSPLRRSRNICGALEDQLLSCSKGLTRKSDLANELHQKTSDMRMQIRNLTLTCGDPGQSAMHIARLRTELEGVLGFQLSGVPKEVLQNAEHKMEMKLVDLAVSAETERAEITALQDKHRQMEEELRTKLDSLSETDCRSQQDLEAELEDKNLLISDLRNTNDAINKDLYDRTVECSEVFEQYKNLDGELASEREKVSELQNLNNGLTDQLSNRTVECTDLQTQLNNVSEKLNEMIHQLPDQPGSNLKLIMEIISLAWEVDSLNVIIKQETSETNIAKLKREIQEKTEELDDKKKQLAGEGELSKQYLWIIEMLEDIWELQDGAEEQQTLDRLAEMLDVLYDKINQLESNSMIKMMFEIMAIQADKSRIKRLTETVSLEEIAELEKQLADKEAQIREKTSELAEKDSDIIKLANQINLLKASMEALDNQLEKLRQTTDQQIADLKKDLEEKTEQLKRVNKEMDEKDAKVAALLKDIDSNILDIKKIKEQAHEEKQWAATQISRLTEKLKKKEEENAWLQHTADDLAERLRNMSADCDGLQGAYNDLRDEFNKTVGQLKNEVTALVLRAKQLNTEIENLNRRITDQKDGVTELQRQLDAKTKELEEALKKIEESGKESQNIIQILELMKKIWVIQQEGMSAQHLAQIAELEKELNMLIEKVRAGGDLTTTLMLQIVQFKDEITRLKTLQDAIRQKHEQEAADLQKQLDEKNKEIAQLREIKEDCNGLKGQIVKLEQEAKKMEREFDKLKKSSAAEISKLQGKLELKNNKVAELTKELKELDGTQADLITKLVDLQTKMNELQTESEKAKQACKKQLSEMDEKLTQAQEQIEEKDKTISKLHEQIKERDKTTETLQMDFDKLKEQLKEKDKENTQLQNRNAELKEQLKEKDKESTQLQNRNADLEKQLSKQDEKLASAQRQIEKKDKTISQLQEKQQEANSKINDLLGKLDDEQKQLNETDEALSMALWQLRDKDNTITRLTDQQREADVRNKELKKMLDKAEGEKDQLEDQLMESQAKQTEMKKEFEENLKLCDAKRIQAEKELQAIKDKEEKKVSIWTSTFDRDSANPLLVFSADNKQFFEATKRQDIPDHPMRYNVAVAVLGKRGFESGRRYWEVGVKGKASYVIGVAKASAPRKGPLAYSPKLGYWTVMRKQSKEFVAKNGRDVFLNVDIQSPPVVIGVLVDVKQRQVDFYNAETEKLLFRFERCTFQGKLFPFFAVSYEGKSDVPMEIIGVESAEWLEH